MGTMSNHHHPQQLSRIEGALYVTNKNPQSFLRQPTRTEQPISRLETVRIARFSIRHEQK